MDSGAIVGAVLKIWLWMWKMPFQPLKYFHQDNMTKMWTVFFESLEIVFLYVSLGFFLCLAQICFNNRKFSSLKCLFLKDCLIKSHVFVAKCFNSPSICVG